MKKMSVLGVTCCVRCTAQVYKPITRNDTSKYQASPAGKKVQTKEVTGNIKASPHSSTGQVWEEMTAEGRLQGPPQELLRAPKFETRES